MTPPPVSEPEAAARVEVDASLVAAGWAVQDRADMNLSASRGVAVREFKLKHGHGFADYLLFVDGKAAASSRPSRPATRSPASSPSWHKYAAASPDGLDPPVAPLPFLYLSTGAVTHFTNLLDPQPAQPPHLPDPPARDARRVAGGARSTPG